MPTRAPFDPHALIESVTDRVRICLDEDDDEPAGSSSGRCHGRSEARRLALDADDIAEAAGALRSWFKERLTVDPGVSGPFGCLASDLIRSALDLVEWEELADEIRD